MTPKTAAKIAQMVDDEMSWSRRLKRAVTDSNNAAICFPQGQDADDGLDASDDGDVGPSDSGSEPVDAEAVKECAGYDHSDTDNGRRLLRHFGEHLRVLKQGDARQPSYAAWRGNFWDVECGNLYAHEVAQKIGFRIGFEADYLALTPFEERLCEDGEQAARDLAALERRRKDSTEAERARARAARGRRDGRQICQGGVQKAPGRAPEICCFEQELRAHLEHVDLRRAGLRGQARRLQPGPLCAGHKGPHAAIPARAGWTKPGPRYLPLDGPPRGRGGASSRGHADALCAA
jgi:hypothetical protein